jgi:hypothetical protein
MGFSLTTKLEGLNGKERINSTDKCSRPNDESLMLEDRDMKNLRSRSVTRDGRERLINKTERKHDGK